MKSLREVNKLADILCDMESRLNDPLLHHSDFCGHLGLSPNPHLTWGRVILRTWFFQNVLKYIWREISADEYNNIRKEYYRIDYLFWGYRIFDTYHKTLLLPKL